MNRKNNEINIDEHDNVNAFVKKAKKTTTFKDFVFLIYRHSTEYIVINFKLLQLLYISLNARLHKLML